MADLKAMRSVVWTVE
jgi:hypothetical protein